MCKFIKQKDKTQRRKSKKLNMNVFALNVGLCALVFGVAGVYAFLAMGNTSWDLSIREKQQKLDERSSETSELTLSLNERRAELLTPETLDKLELVKAGAVEYAKGIGGDVAIR